MLDYLRLRGALQKGLIDLADPAHVEEISDYLADEWIADYGRISARSEIVKVTLKQFSYLFDQRFARLISAWGVSPGATGHVRDKSRVRLATPWAATPVIIEVTPYPTR